MRLNNKIAIVTGGSRGIGADIAYELAANGAEIIIVYKTRDDKAREVVELINSKGYKAHMYKCDVSSFNEVKEFTEEIIERFGKIDILVNNAGISEIGMLIDMEEETWDKISNTNLKSVFNMCKHIGKHMMWNMKGVIINISSIWGEVGASCEVAYSATKGGINAFTRAFAKELAPSGVRVNGISPGVINTEMNKWMTQEEEQELKDEIPMGRFGEGSEIGKIAVFLSSEDSSYMTGQILRVDGGMI
ncbi:elongation factor P 5-aminopentanone reductase [Oceanirhabdus sp. W0125-5]|uniref:elongation factor P 5-aminopentanone reductase n=1 Tax=Oceanirhabdus sp. W0125-5 TaxID=2999116 RepID=UPI0022F30132|nr:SDR family oxidoreductase [Oceanirhabdus sp. W0125-5]WBW96162.1 SDR family oxidoreductase [Oceanirhabdus sp. W0125-5]